jgi:hypothetical protein
MADQQDAPAPADDTRRAVVAATARTFERWRLGAQGLLVAMTALQAALLVFALQDLAYVVGAGGVPSAERAVAMNERISTFGTFGWVVFVVGTIAISRWHGAAVHAVSACGVAIRMPPAHPFRRPFVAFRALDDALVPVSVTPEEADHAGGYRTPAVKRAPVIPSARVPLIVWWSLWIGSIAIFLLRGACTISWTSAKALDVVMAIAGVFGDIAAFVAVARISARLRACVGRTLRALAAT